MAIKIEFTGFINSVKVFEWGTVYDVAHSQRKQNERGEWETIGTDYFSVIGDPGFAETQKVTIKGRLKTKRYDKQDGTKGLRLEVRAEEMALAESARQQDTEAPF